MGWVADEVARRVIKEQPEAFGQGEDGMGARLDDLPPVSGGTHLA